MLELFVIAALTIITYMSGWFVVSILLRRNDIVDLAWGPGFLLVALASMYYMNNFSDKVLLVTALVAVWAVRLALHIIPRLRSKTEDFRYRQWRRQWGKWVYVRSFLQIFLLQGLFMLVISNGVIINAHQSSAFVWYNGLGLVVWVIGFVFETAGDRQLDEFLANPANKGKIMTSGLWRYTRHPNYFGEVAQWWGIFLIVLPSVYWYPALVSPLTITLLILFVSGIPLLEKKFADKPGYKEYARRTSVFIPLPPKK